jgi:uroporphyrinogen-III decarboxylase
MGEITDHSNIIWSCGGGMPPGTSNKNIKTFMDAVKQYSSEL